MTNDLERWAEYRFGQYELYDQREGKYGVVLLFKARNAPSAPERFAVKTIKPEWLSKPESQVRELFEREIGIWLKVPKHPHVLPALGVEIIQESAETTAIPAVRMSYADDTLGAWTRKDDRPEIRHRLSALVEACHGLQWLRAHGVEGHGDLKPNNILLVKRTTMGEALAVPWQARVADLGWANIWKEVGRERETWHGWKPYLAPERLGAGEFEPGAADVFALGVVVFEVLGVGHPAGSRTTAVARWKDKQWTAWATNGTRVLDSLESIKLRDVVAATLSPKPEDRPSLSELMDRLIGEASERGLDLRPALLYGDAIANGSNFAAQCASSIEESARAGRLALDAAIRELCKKVEEQGCDKPAGIIFFRSLGRLLVRRNVSGDSDQAAAMAEWCLEAIVREATVLDLRWELYGVAADGHRLVSKEQALAALVTDLCEIARDAGCSSAKENELLAKLPPAVEALRGSYAAWNAQLRDGARPRQGS